MEDSSPLPELLLPLFALLPPLLPLLAGSLPSCSLTDCVPSSDRMMVAFACFPLDSAIAADAAGSAREMFVVCNGEAVAIGIALPR